VGREQEREGCRCIDSLVLAVVGDDGGVRMEGLDSKGDEGSLAVGCVRLRRGGGGG